MGKKLLFFLIISLFFLVLAAPVNASPPGQDEPTPTYTATPGAATATYQAAYDRYLIAGQEAVPTVIVGSLICGVVVIIFVIAIVRTVLKRPKSLRRRKVVK